jgi:retron-type reverse transcriptase
VRISNSNRKRASDPQSVAHGVAEQLRLFDDDANTHFARDPEPDCVPRDVCMTEGGFSTNNYWSSTENNNNNAWNLNFSNGSWNNNNKNNNNYVRCVRSKNAAASPFQPKGAFTLEEVFRAYFDCRRAKRNSEEQLKFEFNLERNLIDLYESIGNRTYQPGPSVVFAILEPKPREVWAAQFRDRVVHHLIYNRLAPSYHNLFITDTYACIPGRGVHHGVHRAETFARQVTQNYRVEAWYTKVDIANFFCSIDRSILLSQLKHALVDDDMQFVVGIILNADQRENSILRSSKSRMAKIPPHKSLWNAPVGRGLPIGNLTSQFFANVYLDPLDCYVKRGLNQKRYLRYVDDLAMFGNDLDLLRFSAKKIDSFLAERLNLTLHPDKTKFGRVLQGFDFLGFYCLPGRRYLRHGTKARVNQKIQTRTRQFNTGQIDDLEYAQSMASLRGVYAQANHFLEMEQLFG